jgi:RNA polymerase sigma-70 factor (ECF subfamily)
MATTMTLPHGSSLETRPSLLKRLQTGDDPQSWQEFYRIYGGLIRFFATKAGLTADEAEEVVQETAIGVARRLPQFVYDPKVCRFKTWLLNLTRWRIQNQLRKRGQLCAVAGGSPTTGDESRAGCENDGTGTASIDCIADPAVPEFGAEWDAAWEKNLVMQAMEQVHARIEERQFQIFDLYVMKGWPAGDVAKTLGISIARVYLTKHRVAARVKKEVQRLEKAAEQARLDCGDVAH